MTKFKPGQKPGKGSRDYAPTYQPAQLRYMLGEHLLEHMSCVELGKALGINKNSAWRLKRDPGACVDTPLEWDDAAIVRVRKYLEAQL